ncbi:alpha-glucosidase-like [Venturia canescens]|uniref:alpha-glucosidase-like n=1 Tax=Venturia canescens TaxID=32260 RepID=UPI001C9C11A5|nr:alpha-glucosidase-like [Venturia canescens]XP_043273404.1 alpha-glucosidase-like [Venturia canescens]XP_043273405.1 alpha-glucosidase-like [Venturia canescens]XP_043273406.1 alpha-glucosidase-like [Venturia canescens]XP_043273407.1 alpha-glucosidase-like [Venturia canescens]XP_043273409.1 alpha-glucosidase-like [Venturia canescens]
MFGRKVLLTIASLLILESNKCSCTTNFDEEEWWENMLVYEIWPTSFQDSDGDGIGDLQGIIRRLDYLEDLGVETICLNPIFASPLSDGGFDVSDYENINRILGNLSDFDKLVQEVHDRDMKLVLDVVPNHTSDEHKWFEASKNMLAPFEDYYIWANGTFTPDGTPVPPNHQIVDENDVKNSVWSYNSRRGQWYYHTFGEFQPDLNLDNADVRRDVMGIFDFWLNRGVDGFRITGAPYFFEDFHLGNDRAAVRTNNFSDESRNVQFLYDIREHVDQWAKLNSANSKYLTTSTYDTKEHLLSYYTEKKNDTMSVIPPNYCFLQGNVVAGPSASRLGHVIEQWLNAIPMNESTVWMLSNRDTLRITSRVGPDRLDALLMLSILLPGQTYTFYGDEIGLSDIPIPTIGKTHATLQTYSPIALMQWDDSLSAGFSNATHLSIPIHDNYMYINVAEQLKDPHSHLNVFKKLAHLKYEFVIRHGDWEIESMNDDTVFVLRRTLTDHPIYILVINLSNDQQIVNMTKLYPDLKEYLDVIVTSGNDNMLREVVSRNYFPVRPNAGIVLMSDTNENVNSSEIDVGREGTKELENSQFGIRGNATAGEPNDAAEKKLDDEVKEFEKTEEAKVEEGEKGNVEADGREEKTSAETAEKENVEKEVNLKIPVKENEMEEKNKKTAKEATLERKVLVEEKKQDSQPKQKNGENNEKLATEIPEEISMENNSDIKKQTYENVRTESNSTVETTSQRPSSTDRTTETRPVTGGKNSVMADWHLLTIVITNYIIVRIC